MQSSNVSDKEQSNETKNFKCICEQHSVCVNMSEMNL